ncbi:hypothetical protein [Streptomyces sp. NPDC001774]
MLKTDLNSTSISITSISGGGVTTWAKAVGPFASNSPANQELWWGQATATGSSTMTVTWSSSVSGIGTTLCAQQFAPGIGSPVWGVDASGTFTTASSSTVTYPTLAPTGGAEMLYVGGSYAGVGGTTGSTPGYVYQNDSNGDAFIYHTGITASTSPTSSQGGASYSDTVAALFYNTPPAVGPVARQLVLTTRAVQRAAFY